MADKQQVKSKTYMDKVLRRAREIGRVKAGKASETPGNPEKVVLDYGENETAGRGNSSVVVEKQNNARGNPDQHLQIDEGTAGTSKRGSSGKPAQNEKNLDELAQGENYKALWEKITNMEAEKSRFENQQTELLSNIVVNVAKMQQKLDTQLEKGANSSSVDCPGVTQPDEEEIGDELDDMFQLSTSEECSDDTQFLNEFDGLYDDSQQFGPNIDEKIASLLDKAIDKPMPEDQERKMREKYLIPGNCQRPQWQGQRKSKNLQQAIISEEPAANKQKPDLPRESLESKLLQTNTLNVSTLINVKNAPDTFQGGQLKHFKSEWEKITSDQWILETISGYNVEIVNWPQQHFIPQPIPFNPIEKAKINEEILCFLQKGIIEEVHSKNPYEFYSNIFVRPKKDGTVRVILNLKKFNDYVDKIHFKMETLKAVANSIQQGDYFASIDLKDAYFSVPVTKNDRKYLRFVWNDKKYQFCVLPQGLACSPRVFTKILKPVYSTLRKVGHFNAPYIDDSLLKAETYHDCLENIYATISLVDRLGFTVHPEKSVFIPTQKITFLGFLLNSIDMTIKLTQDKTQNLVELCSSIINKESISIREFATLIGKMVASEPGVQFAPLFYKDLEHIKEAELRRESGNYEAQMSVSKEIRNNLKWWIHNLDSSYKPIVREEPSVIIHSDASQKGWGGTNNSNNTSINGTWNKSEKEEHINYLELKGASLVIKQLLKLVQNAHIMIYMDNTVAVSYINNFGGKIEKLHNLTKELWFWAMSKNIWLTAAHVPGIDNFEADRLSRKINDDMEWMIKPSIFERVEKCFGKIDIDLFASKMNNQTEKYVSYRPDKFAMAVDAFTLKWKKYRNMYLFPPFSVLGKTIQKIRTEEISRLLLIAPIWPTQVWFTPLLQNIMGQSFILPKNCLQLPLQTDKKHPIRNLRLGAFILSGNALDVEAYHRSLSTSSWGPGDSQLSANTGLISKNGCSFVVKRKLITLIHLPE